MKILIITYSREVNPGTFLQAYGVQYFFRQLYPDAQIDLLKHKRKYSFIANPGTSVGNRGKGWAFVKEKLLVLPRRMKYEYAYRIFFHLTSQEFDLFDYEEQEFREFVNSYDLAIVGSDTILTELKRDGHYGLMWLQGVTTPKILFAASAAPLNFLISEEEKNTLKNSFKDYLYLGVRDSVTKIFLSNMLGLHDMVCHQFDPTYIIPDNKFRLPLYYKFIGHCPHKIVLVNFGKSFEYQKHITEYVRNKGYYVISTIYNPWADKNLLSLTPFEWGALFRYVDVTITERFHDSVFTLRNNKPVIAVDRKSNRYNNKGMSKTRSLLSDYQQDSYHIIIKGENDLRNLFNLIDNVNIISETNDAVIRKTNEKIQDEYEALKIRIKHLIH